MGSDREYRVVWKRGREPRWRRLYQTEQAARDFAAFLERSDDTYDNLTVAVESRTVGSWEVESE